MTDTVGTDDLREPLKEIAGAVWWLPLVRGVLLVILGVVALVWPGMALLVLVYLFGFYAILDGIMAITMGIRARKSRHAWGWLVAQGVISVLAGLVALIWPGVTALSLLFVVAIWAIVLGVATVVEAVRTRAAHDRWGWTLLGGVLDVVFGVLLLVWPATGILALLWLLGIFALVAGIVLIVLAFRIRSLAKA